MDNTFVRDVMSKNTLTTDASTSLQESAQKMLTLNVGCIIVTENSKPVGIATERDFVTKVVAQGRLPSAKICEIMSSPLITIDPEDTIWDASETMKEQGIHKLPVKEKDDSKILGVLTTSDIVKIASVGSDSQMRKICDQILLRMQSK